MTKGRLEAFTDGVMAIVITIMVLELHVPSGTDLGALRPLIFPFLSYVLSFVLLGIYWNNHHHLMQAVHRVNGRILWANLHLLFWLSLTPAVTAWMGETRFAAQPAAVYGVVLLMSAISYYILTLTLVAEHGTDSTIAAALGHDFKGKISIVLYLVAIIASQWNSVISYSIYVLVTIMWLVPDKRIERTLAKNI